MCIGTKPVLVDRLTQHEAITLKALSSLAMDVSDDNGNGAEEAEVGDENKAPPAAVVNMQQLKPRRSLKFDLDELIKDIDNNRSTTQMHVDGDMMMEE